MRGSNRRKYDKLFKSHENPKARASALNPEDIAASGCVGRSAAVARILTGFGGKVNNVCDIANKFEIHHQRIARAAMQDDRMAKRIFAG